MNYANLGITPELLNNNQNLNTLILNGAVKSEDEVEFKSNSKKEKLVIHKAKNDNSNKNYESHSFEYLDIKYEHTSEGIIANRTASATENSVVELRNIANSISIMVNGMSRLQATVNTEVLPKWFQSLNESTETTNTSLQQAGKSLFWTKWAVVVSIVISILTTSWQIWVDHKYKLDADIQQADSEFLANNQLSTLKEININLVSELKLLQSKIDSLNKNFEQSLKKSQ